MPVALRDFPAGARSGLMMHHLLEHLDFTTADPNRPVPLIEEALKRYGFETSWAGPLNQALVGALRTPLAPGEEPLTLARIPAADRLDELEFTFPLERLTPARLADALRDHPAAPWPAGYPDQLAALEFSPLGGFLTGFADLVFRFEERWYIADYKSNLLGRTAAQYTAEELAGRMAAHHYYLQYHIYLAALHRYFTRRLPDYDYERHFGGVYYLFLRGMHPDHPPGCGVYADRPPRALVERLDALFGGGP